MKGSRLSSALAMATVGGAIFAVLLTIVALVRVMRPELQRNITSLSEALALGAWNVSPYVALGMIAWSVRTRIVSSVVVLIGTVVVVTPAAILLGSAVGSAGIGGDGQLGLWLVLFPVAQWATTGVVGLIAALVSLVSGDLRGS